jgi:hypothetical protein
MGETTTLDFQISYAEDAVSITAKIGPSPNQDRKQRVQTIEETLKHHHIAYELANEEVRIFLHSEADAEKVLESFRVFEKQDKIKETKLYVNKKIASELEKKLKSIFPPPESAVSIRCGQYNVA